MQVVNNSEKHSGLIRANTRGDFLAILPWLVLPYDSVTHLLGADISTTSQTLPLTALLAIPYIILRGSHLRSNRTSSSVFKLMLLAFLIMLMVTTANAFIEYSINLNADNYTRALVGSRQAISMLLGLCSFLMLQDAILRINIQGVARYLVLGFIPSLLWGSTQVITDAYRVQGFSSEPSHLADMLVFVFLPALTLIKVSRQIRLFLVVVGVTLLLLTFSTTGYLKALLAVAIYYILQGRVVSGLFKIIISSGLFIAVLNFFPDNYVFTIYKFMIYEYEQTGQLGTGSFIDRFYGFSGPISQLSGVHGWLGFGFGGDTVYFDSLFSESNASAIREVKGDIAAISSLQGKMLMYGGVLGYIIYLYAWKRSMTRIPKTHIAKVMIPVVFAGSVFSLGPIFLPYVWLWLAIGASLSEEDRATHLIYKTKASVQKNLSRNL